ncbi:unnamed protein product [Linum trigynum]|uniref:FAF domain-containing protein n=1 Tax=Linum trigynum TaxID=586398 RepID=A0AAV2ETY4_9ROSI
MKAPSAASGFLEECIGCESCLDLNTHTQDHLLHLFPAPTAPPNCDMDNHSADKEEERAHDHSSDDVIDSRWSAMKEYPPPIPLLARRGKLASWVLRRHYTSDGRLVLTEDKACTCGDHRYFRAHRSKGRLTLHLQLHNHDDDDDDDSSDELEPLGLGCDDCEGAGGFHRGTGIDAAVKCLNNNNNNNSSQMRAKSILCVPLVPTLRPLLS